MAKVGVLFNGVPMLTDAVHHPNNTPGVPMAKETGETLDPSCCCVDDIPGCCCERHPGPASLFVTISGGGICGCLDGTYELTRMTFLECPPASPVEGFNYKGTFEICGADSEIELSCEPPTVSIQDLAFARDAITWDGSIGETHLIDCDPMHIILDAKVLSIQETADWCGGDGIDDVETVSGDVTE